MVTIACLAPELRAIVPKKFQRRSPGSRCRLNLERTLADTTAESKTSVKRAHHDAMFYFAAGGQRRGSKSSAKGAGWNRGQGARGNCGFLCRIESPTSFSAWAGRTCSRTAG